MTEVAMTIRAYDKASGVLGRVAGKMGIMSKQGIGMGIAFAGINLAVGAVMGAISRFGSMIDESFNKARQFSRGIAEVSTLLDEMGMIHLPAMTTGVRELAIEMGKSVFDLTKGLYQTLSATVDAGEAMKFLKISATAAVGGLTDVETAVDAISTVMNAYGMTVNEAKKISDIMFTTVKRGKLNFEQLSNSIGTLVPIAAQAGIAFEQISAAIATLTRQGIIAQKATMSLRQLIANLIAPSVEAANAAKEYGIVLNDISLEVLGLEGMMVRLEEVTDGNIGALQTMIPNIRALQAGLGLTGEAAKGFAFDVKEMGNAMNATAIAAEKMRTTMDFQFSQLEARIEDLKIKMGLTPSVQKGKELWEHIQGYALSALGTIGGGLQMLGVVLFQTADTWEASFRDILGTTDDLTSALEAVDSVSFSLDQTLSTITDDIDAMTIAMMAIPKDELMGFMSQWGREIDANATLISRLEHQTDVLTIEIGDLTDELERYETIKDYTDALYYIPIALEDASYQSKIYNNEIGALVDSIRSQKNAVDQLNDANRQLSISSRQLSIESLEIELRSMNRRGRISRADERRLERIRRAGVVNRIQTMKNQQAISDIEEAGLTEDESRLQKKIRDLQQSLKEEQDILDTTLRDLKNNLKWKQEEYDLYYGDYLPTMRTKELVSLTKFHAGLLAIEKGWTEEEIRIWEATTGSIIENINKIIDAKAGLVGTTAYAPQGDAYSDWAWEQYKAENYQHGGIVPGPIGQPVPIIAHGGERYLGTSGRGGGGVFHVDPISVNIQIYNHADLEASGNQIGRMIASGMISELESEYEVA